MTIHDVSTQLLSLSVDKKINGIKRSTKSLETFISTMFNSPLKAGNKLVAEIRLPDGSWYFYIIRFAPNEYDYYLPDTREDEEKVVALLH